MIESAKVLRRRNEHAWQFFAGPGVLYDGNEHLLDYVDAVLLGEGEVAVPAVIAKGVPPCDEEFPEGWMWRGRDGKTRSSGMPTSVDVAVLPFPTWELFPLEAYLERSLETRGYPVAHIMTSRGCPRACIFCDRRVGGVSVRRRPPESVVAELLDLEMHYAEWQLKDFYFFDPAFLSSRQWAETFFKQVNAVTNIRWGCEARVDEVDESLLHLARDAGCAYMNFGVESGNNSLLRTLRKGITVEQTIEVFGVCHRLGIRPGALVMIGLPGETEEDIEDLKRLLLRIRPSFVNISIAAPYPGTALTEMYRERLVPLTMPEFGDYYPERSLFTGLKVDPARAREELLVFYKTEVCQDGVVNPQ